jgi:hypothetical protein
VDDARGTTPSSPYFNPAGQTEGLKGGDKAFFD